MFAVAYLFDVNFQINGCDAEIGIDDEAEGFETTVMAIFSVF